MSLISIFKFKFESFKINQKSRKSLSIYICAKAKKMNGMEVWENATSIFCLWDVVNDDDDDDTNATN